MKIEIEDKGSVTLLMLHGERLDAVTAPEFKTHVEELVALERSRIVLDLSEVNFVDSSGLTQVVMLYKSLVQMDGGRLVVSGAKGVVTNLLRLSRLDRVVELFETTEKAIEAFND